MKPPTDPPPGFRFGVFELDPRAGELRKSGHRVRLQEQPLRILTMLLLRPGDTVTREELRQQLWPDDTAVDFDHGLNNAVNRLREALGDSAETPHFVETLPRRGYRFIGAVEALHDRPPVASGSSGSAVRLGRPLWRIGVVLAGLLSLVFFGVWRLGTRDTGPSPGRVTLAVLPFQNMSGDPEQEHFSDGLTEEMITQLGQFDTERLGVIARTSSMYYKGKSERVDRIGHDLGVDYLLEGSVRRSGDRVRITAQLIRVRDQTHLWAGRYERALGNVFSVEEEVAHAIAQRIRLTLTPWRGGARAAFHLDPEAHELYWKAQQLAARNTESSLMASIDLFEQAARREPGYAAARSGQALSYLRLSSFYRPPREVMPKALAAANQALELDDTLAEAHTVRGSVELLYNWDWRAANRELRRAIELHPSSAEARAWYGFYLMTRGQHGAAIAEARRAQELDPLSPVRRTDTQWILLMARRYDEAIEVGRQALAIEPGFALAYSYTGLAHAQRGEPTETLAALEAGRRLDDSTMPTLFLAFGHAIAGEPAKARTIVAELVEASKQRYVCPYEIATAYVGLGEDDEAFGWLQKATDDRSDCMTLLNVEPWMDSLRQDARFADLLNQIRPPSSAAGAR